MTLPSPLYIPKQLPSPLLALHPHKKNHKVKKNCEKNIRCNFLINKIGKGKIFLFSFAFCHLLIFKENVKIKSELRSPSVSSAGSQIFVLVF